MRSSTMSVRILSRKLWTWYATGSQRLATKRCSSCDSFCRRQSSRVARRAYQRPVVVSEGRVHQSPATVEQTTWPCVGLLAIGTQSEEAGHYLLRAAFAHTTRVPAGAQACRLVVAAISRDTRLSPLRRPNRSGLVGARRDHLISRNCADPAGQIRPFSFCELTLHPVLD